MGLKMLDGGGDGQDEFVNTKDLLILCGSTGQDDAKSSFQCVYHFAWLLN
jgi:hypothetical protein